MNQLLSSPKVSNAAELTSICQDADGTDLRTNDPYAVWTYSMDGNMPVCMTLDMLDEWWRSKSPQEKAEMWEKSLEDQSPLTAQSSIELLIAAIHHPVNLIFEAAEQLAQQHRRVAVDAVVEAEHALRRCSGSRLPLPYQSPTR